MRWWNCGEGEASLSSKGDDFRGDEGVEVGDVSAVDCGGDVDLY